MKAFVKIFILGLISLSLITCEDNKPSTTLIIPEGATNIGLVVKENKVFSIKVNGNPTTGYMWVLENPDLNGAITPLQLGLGNTGVFKPDKHAKGMVGVGGVFEFKFLAGKAQNNLITLNFAYKRSWETENGRTVSVQVHITP